MKFFSEDSDSEFRYVKYQNMQIFVEQICKLQNFEDSPKTPKAVNP